MPPLRRLGAYAAVVMAIALVTALAAGRGAQPQDSARAAIPNRGPCLMTPIGTGTRLRTPALVFLRVRDRWEDVGRSLIQLVLGTYMVWDARRLRLCERYFDEVGRRPT